MSIATRICLLFIFFLHSAIVAIPSLNPSLYESDAQNWISTHILNDKKQFSLKPRDLQIILNLIYFSYARSAITIKSQEICLNALQEVWHGWQNITHTRMNPSREYPYSISLKTQKDIFTEFMQAEQKYTSIAATYDSATENILKELELNVATENAISHLRSRAREIVVKTFFDVQKIVDELSHFMHQWNNRALPSENNDLISRFELLSSIWNYVPYTALKSFIELDNASLAASQQSWNLLFAIQLTSKSLWDAIEQARASYYLAHYLQLYALMQKHFPQNLYSLYDETGSKEKIESVLPDLSKRC